MNVLLNVHVQAALAGLVVTAATLPFWRTRCRHAGLVDDPGERKIHDRPVPLAGGPAILTGILLPLLVLTLAREADLLDAKWTGEMQRAFSREGTRWAGLLAGAAGMVALGWVDDRRELGAGAKFIGQLLAALLVAACGIRVTLFVPNVAFSYALTVLWILAVTNAFNFMDNMNGLCGGIGVIASVAFGFNAARADQPAVAALAMLVAGALCGFLPYNFPRATVFLGDSGSHLVGYLLAVLAILPQFHSPRHPQPWAVLKPLLILAVPLLDLVWVVFLRWRRGKPFYVGDTNHFSHQLVRRGWSRTGAVMLLWLVAALLGAFTLLF